MSNAVIRPAEVRDAAALAEGNVRMALETEGKALDAETVRCGVRAVVDDPAKGFYLVAEQDGTVVGQLMITYEWSDWRNGVFWWIQSVYVWPEHRRRGIFRRLHEDLVARARRAGCVCGLRLYVEKQNARAQATYAALGLAPNHYQFYEIEFPRTSQS
jgi:GNAT superfamily N-acetyltransferase